MLEGRNVFLRTVKEVDLGELYACFDSIRMKGEYLSGELLSEHQFRLQFYESGFWGEERGTVVLEREGRLVGAIWFEKQSFFDCLDLRFYIFRQEDRGKGFMREAICLFSRYLFSTKKVERLQVCVPDYSKAALKLMKACGFQFEGIARRALFGRGIYLDLCVYSLLRQECELGSKKL